MLKGIKVNKYRYWSNKKSIPIPRYCDKCGKSLKQIVGDWKYTENKGEKYLDRFYLVCPDWNDNGEEYGSNWNDNGHNGEALDFRSDGFYENDSLKKKEIDKVKIALGIVKKTEIVDHEDKKKLREDFAERTVIINISGLIWGILLCYLWRDLGKDANSLFIWSVVTFGLSHLANEVYVAYKLSGTNEKKTENIKPKEEKSKSKKKRRFKMPRIFRYVYYWLLISLLWKFVVNIEEIVAFLINKFL